jgi:hypothetical protein
MAWASESGDGRIVLGRKEILSHAKQYDPEGRTGNPKSKSPNNERSHATRIADEGCRRHAAAAVATGNRPPEFARHRYARCDDGPL